MKKIRWGLIGASRIAAEWVIPAIRENQNSEIVAVQGSDADRVAAYAAQHNIPQHFTAVDDLLSAEIDAVYISNTNEHHAPCALAALAAGKHVLGEKPMAMTIEDAESMVATAARKGLVLAVNHHLRAMNSHRELRDMVVNGELGKLVAVRVTFGVLLPEENRGWRTDSVSAGAGVFFDLSVHDADLLHFILGEKIVRVATFASNNGISAKGIEDTVATIAQTESGLLVQILESFAMEHGKTSLELHGTKASVLCEDVLLQRAGGTLELSVQGKKSQIQIVHDNAYPRVISAFNDAVRGKGSPITTGEDGLAALRLAIAARTSVETGDIIELSTLNRAVA